MEGRIGELEALLSVAWLDREADSVLDYTEYPYIGNYLPYYLCDARLGNLTDERAVLTSWYGNDRERLTVNRPRSFGIQVTHEM